MIDRTKVHRVDIVDGSTYSDVSFRNPTLDCLTIAGVQTVNVYDPYARLEGHIVDDLDALRANLGCGNK